MARRQALTIARRMQPLTGAATATVIANAATGARPIFLCMLTYCVEWHLIDAWRPCSSQTRIKSQPSPLPFCRTESMLLRQTPRSRPRQVG